MTKIDKNPYIKVLSDRELLLTSVIITTPRIQIEIEMERLRQLRYDESDWWEDKCRSDWARGTYGKELNDDITIVWGKKRDGDIHFMSLIPKLGCQICGKLFGLDEEFVYLKMIGYDEGFDLSVHKNLSCMDDV